MAEIEIPRRFHCGRTSKPVVRTVGDLKKILSLLPDDLRICRGMGRGPRRCVVYNIGDDPEFDLMESYP